MNPKFLQSVIRLHDSVAKEFERVPPSTDMFMTGKVLFYVPHSTRLVE